MKGVFNALVKFCDVFGLTSQAILTHTTKYVARIIHVWKALRHRPCISPEPGHERRQKPRLSLGMKGVFISLVDDVVVFGLTSHATWTHCIEFIVMDIHAHGERFDTL